ncbi:MAG: DUF1360 domain-containing protein [Anaerolineaceae bacterium]|nr:DUF1360 domain-containing protein [Anaerolineaceae bacterium]
MNTKSDRSSQQEAATKVAFTIAFLLVFAGFIVVAARLIPIRLDTPPGVFDFVLLAFATMRLGRMVAYDRVMEPFRAPFTITVPDKSGVGKTVVARGTGIRCSIGQLISCPICVGTWIAAGLVYALYAFPGPARVFIIISAAIGLAEMLNGVIEAFSWSGHLARTMAGTQMAAKKGQAAEIAQMENRLNGPVKMNESTVHEPMGEHTSQNSDAA